MVFSNIFNAKVIYYEIESDRAKFVDPEARHGESLLVAISTKALGKDIIGKLARLQKPLEYLFNIELHPTDACKLVEIVFQNEFFWGI